MYWNKPCLSNQTLSELSTNTNTLLNDAFVPIIASAANHQIKHHRQRTQPLNEQIAHVYQATVHTDDFMILIINMHWLPYSPYQGVHFVLWVNLCKTPGMFCVILQVFLSFHSAPNEALRGINFHPPITGSWQPGSPPTQN